MSTNRNDGQTWKHAYYRPVDLNRKTSFLASSLLVFSRLSFEGPNYE